ncbi:MAG: sugar phosphate isomerase/epimerase [Clostridiales bacterium]|nr:sugar phosphate isomerase/epimerase [Clostridiales bacterium]
MRTGASTSCYYPLETELALERVISLGFSRTEIFFNTFSELEEPFLKGLSNQAKQAGVRVCSVHPFSSFAETQCLFGNYERRADDTIERYKAYFHACNLLGAQIVVLHGAFQKMEGIIPHERYFERFARLSDTAASFGVTLAQENVNAYFSQSPDFLQEMKRQLGGQFKLVFDIKQAVRAGYDPFVFTDLFAQDIVHVHVSDNLPGADCLLPGSGTFDFRRLLHTLEQTGYNGTYMIEVYFRNAKNMDEELAASRCFLEGI